MGGCRLLYFVKSKNGVVLLFLCKYIHSFIFPEMVGRGGCSPPSQPPKSATGEIYQEFIIL